MSLNVLQVIARTGRLHGVWASGNEPSASEAADALTAFNTMKRAWFGTLIGPRLSPITLTGAAAQAENGGEYLIPGGAPFTLAAPAAPRAGDRFGVVDATLNWSSHPLTVVPGGRLINGAAANALLATSGQNTRWWFRGDAGAWVAEADAASLTSAIEFPDPVIAYMPYMLALAIAAEYEADLRPEVVAAAQEGRAVLARTYGRRGRGQAEGPIGLAAPMAGQG